jgi:hypothetical protein
MSILPGGKTDTEQVIKIQKKHITEATQRRLGIRTSLPEKVIFKQRHDNRARDKWVECKE